MCESDVGGCDEPAVFIDGADEFVGFGDVVGEQQKVGQAESLPEGGGGVPGF